MVTNATLGSTAALDQSVLRTRQTNRLAYIVLAQVQSDPGVTRLAEEHRE